MDALPIEWNPFIIIINNTNRAHKFILQSLVGNFDNHKKELAKKLAYTKMRGESK